MNQTGILTHRNALHFHRLPQPYGKASMICHINRPNHPEPKKVVTKKTNCLLFPASLSTYLKAVVYSKNAWGWSLGWVKKGPPISLPLRTLGPSSHGGSCNCNSNTWEEAE